MSKLEADIVTKGDISILTAEATEILKVSSSARKTITDKTGSGKEFNYR